MIIHNGVVLEEFPAATVTLNGEEIRLYVRFVEFVDNLAIIPQVRRVDAEAWQSLGEYPSEIIDQVMAATRCFRSTP